MSSNAGIKQSEKMKQLLTFRQEQLKAKPM